MISTTTVAVVTVGDHFVVGFVGVLAAAGMVRLGPRGWRLAMGLSYVVLMRVGGVLMTFLLVLLVVLVLLLLLLYILTARFSREF